MVDRDVVFEKVGNIQRCLRRIREKTGMDPASLDDLDIQEIFVLNLQRATQSAIDLAAHIVADEGLGLPRSLKENFRLLAKAGILSHDVAGRMEAMVGFRNIAVHEYQAIDVNVLKAILSKHLGDLVEFYQQVLDRFGLGVVDR